LLKKFQVPDRWPQATGDKKAAKQQTPKEDKKKKEPEGEAEDLSATEHAMASEPKSKDPFAEMDKG
jgi:hypothetical protein